jgi:hypothetical protein
MSYIGASPTTAAFVTDTFSANGSGTVFTLSVAPANTNSILVAVSGVLQDPSTYSVAGTALTFSAAPPAGTGNISVRFLGIPASGVTNTAYRTQTEFTATAGQTTFSVPSYTVGFIDVYRNGALLGSADFTATNGTTVVLTNAASSGDLIETISFFVSSVINAIPATAGSVINSYIFDGAVTNSKITSMDGSKLTGTQVIPKATLPTGSVLQVVSTNYTGTVSSTSATLVDVTGFSATITPTSATSKVLVMVSTYFGFDASDPYPYILVKRNGTSIGTGANATGNQTNVFLCGPSVPGTGFGITVYKYLPASKTFLDSPSSTSALTYQVQFAQPWVGATGYLNRQSDATNNPYVQSTSSTITLMEIAA